MITRARQALESLTVSVIVYRNGIMASDSRAYSGSHRPLGKKVKIRRMTDGVLVGVGTSTPGLGEWLTEEWWPEGHPDVASPPFGADKVFSLLAVMPDGRAMYADDCLALAGPIEAPYFAIGSGGSYALGALAHGADAVEAVRIAVSLDPLCAGPICVIEHNKEGYQWLD